MSEAATWAYSPRQVTVSFADILIDGGFGEDEFLSIEKQEDDTIDIAGVGGDVAVSVIADNRATCSLTLLATSDMNDRMSALRAAGRLTAVGVAVGEFYVADRLGRSIHKARSAWIQKPPQVTYARGPGQRVWTIRIANLNTFNGGNIAL